MWDVDSLKEYFIFLTSNPQQVLNDGEAGVPYGHPLGLRMSMSLSATVLEVVEKLHDAAPILHSRLYYANHYVNSTSVHP